MDHISLSQISCYLQCPLKYRFTYIEKLPKPFKPSGLALGSAVHTAVAWWNQQRLEKPEANIPLEELHRIFEADWYAQLAEEVQFKEGETEESLLAQGRALIGLYQEAYLSIPPGVVESPFLVALEHPLTGEVLNLPLKGYIDFRNVSGAIHELKTSAKTFSEGEADNHLQLTGYAYACWQTEGAIPELLLVQLVKTKKPKITFWPTNRAIQDFCRFHQLAQQVIRGIETGIFYPNPSYGGNCCCEYVEQCRKWNG